MTVRDMRRSMTVYEFQMWIAYANFRGAEYVKNGKKQRLELW